jgi:hypothetical protein
MICINASGHESGILVLVWKKLKVVVSNAERKNIGGMEKDESVVCNANSRKNAM